MSSFEQKILKKLDATVGKFLIEVLCFIWKKNFGEKEKVEKTKKIGIKNVLVIRPGGLGDTILLTPLIIFLKDKLNVQIDFLGEKRNIEGARFCYRNLVSNFFVYDSLNFIFFFFKSAVRKYDIVIDTEQSFLLPAFFGRIIGKILVGFDTTEKKKLFDIKAEYLFSEHETKNFIRLGEKILSELERNHEENLREDQKVNEQKFKGKEYDGFSIRNLSDELIRKSRDFLKEKVKFIDREKLDIVFAPFTTKWEKSYDEFDQLIEAVKDKGYKVKVIGNRKLSFEEIAQTILSAKIFVGVDNGLMHLAYMMGKKVVAIFGPSNHIKWGPLMGEIIRKNLWCSPCSNFAEIPPCSRNKECMRIEKEKIIEVIERILNQETGI